MNTDTFFEQFDSLIELPGGVGKIRELILQLAVQGKLVEQDANDGTARELVQRIVAAKETKRSQADMESLNHDEISFAIPDQWIWAKLKDLSLKITDGTHRSPPNTPSGEFMYVTAKNIKDHGIDARHITYVTAKIHNEIYSRCNPELGDILYIKDGATTGIVTINDLPRPFSMLSSVALIKIPSDICNRYLLYALRSPYFYGLMRKSMSGVAITRVTLQKLSNALIPLPPLAEQRRIVAKVDQLMALCDELEARQERKREGRERLVESSLANLLAAQDPAECAEHWRFIHDRFEQFVDAPKAIDRLRNAIVELAITGKLSSQLPTDGNAAAEIEQIGRERQALKDRGEIPKQPAILPVDPVFCTYEVPDSWEWARFGDLCLFIEAGWSPQCESRPRGEDEWGVLKISAVTWGRFDPFENKALPRSMPPRPECEVRDGDFLMTRANTVDLVARSVVVSDPPSKLLLNDKTLRVRFPSLVDKRYVSLFNNSSVARSYYRTVASGTSESMRNVSRESILSMPIAVPPFDEQRRIVESCERLNALCDQLDERLRRCSTIGEFAFTVSLKGMLDSSL